MKRLTILALAAITAAASAQDEAPAPPLKPGPGATPEAPAPTLKPGAGVTPDALAKADWIQGSAPDEWEEGKVYLLECWATWCGPCIAAIPHVNELHEKYSAKGLRVCGMNVWEDGREKVAKFVEQQAERMSYPVAYTGRGSDFEKEWLKAAGVRGIPHAFVVKDGKLLFTTHPSQLTNEVVEALLAGGEAQASAIKGIQDAAERRQKTSGLLGKFRTAMSAKDTDAMAQAIAELEALDAAAPFLPQMKLDLAYAAEDWESAGSLIDELATTPAAGQILSSLAFRCDRAPDQLPDELRTRIAGHLAKALEGQEGQATSFVLLSRLHWSVGDKEAAKTAAKTAVENPGDMPAAPFERYLASVEDGEPAAAGEVFKWLRDEMSKDQQR